MGKIRYFTCGEMADCIESEGAKHLKEQMELFRQWEKAVGEIRGCTDVPGLKLDFNLGLRLQIPAGNWHVTIRDQEREALYFDEDVSDVMLISLDKYLICWQIDVFLDGGKVFSHEFDMSGQKVFIGFGSGAMGDILAMLPYVRRFAAQYRCQVVCCLPGYMEELAAWLYPLGWELVTAYLKELGYRVLCIDRDRRQEKDGYISAIPRGAEDFTGALPLLDRAELLYYADFFIGLGSGLSWLAYTVGCPVILISGMSEPWYEFPTPYRVINYLACHGCFQDLSHNFLDSPCPRHGGTERELECSKRITPQQVIRMINRCLTELQG